MSLSLLLGFDNGRAVDVVVVAVAIIGGNDLGCGDCATEYVDFGVVLRMKMLGGDDDDNGRGDAVVARIVLNGDGLALKF